MLEVRVEAEVGAETLFLFSLPLIVVRGRHARLEGSEGQGVNFSVSGGLGLYAVDSGSRPDCVR